MNPALLAFLFCLLLMPLGVAEAQEEMQPATGEVSAPESEDSGSQEESAEDTPAVESAPQPQASGPSVPRTICHGRRIETLRVRGNRRVDVRDVQANMQLREGLPCTDEEVARDARSLWNTGFFDDIVFAATPEGDGIVLTVQLMERPSVAEIVFEGNDEVSEEDLDERVTLRENSILSVPEVRRQVNRIRDLYAEEGHFLAEVRHEIVPDGERGESVAVRFVITEGPKVEVRQIRFVGNQHFNAEDLHGIMQTSETGFFSFLSSSNTFNEETFDEDVMRLQAYYHEHGYLTVSVGEPLIQLTPDRRHIDITIPLREGPRFRIGDLIVEEVNAAGDPVEALADVAVLEAMIDAERGDWLRRSVIAQSLQDITRLYRDAGYARAEVTPDTDMNVEENIVGLTVRIVRGPPVTVERINIRGNAKTRDLVIRRELEFNEGELYSMTDLEESRINIMRLGYFERVDITEERGSAPDRIVVNIEVGERSTGTFQVGFGFSSLESILLNAQIQQNNFLGRGQSLALQLQISGIRQNVQARFTEPWFLGSRWRVSATGFRTSQQYLDFNRQSTGGSISADHPLGIDELRLAVQYQADLIDILPRTGGVFGASGAAGFNTFQQLPLANLFRDGLSSSVRLSLIWDSRNNQLLPTGGVYASLSSEVADTFLGSETTFIRNSLVLRYYRELFDFLVLKTNLNAGLITSRNPDGVPIFERFNLGGIYTVRGFRLNSLGPHAGLPRDIDPNASVSPFGVPIGGNLRAYYNIELEFPILASVGIRGVLFTDGGNAWNLEDSLCQAPLPELADSTTDPCGVDLTQIRTSWGFGVRWQSPLGPLRFEWGLPFNPRDHEEAMRFEFTIGNFF